MGLIGRAGLATIVGVALVIVMSLEPAQPALACEMPSSPRPPSQKHFLRMDTVEPELSLSYSVDNALLLPGETAAFTLLLDNNLGVDVAGVVVDNPLPAVLEAISADVAQGTATINGQLVSFNIGTLASGQSVTMTVNARARSEVKPPADAISGATVRYDGGVPRTSTAHVRITSGSLPNTGERPAPPSFGGIYVAAILSLCCGLFIYIRYVRRTQD